jgi:retinol dehydrogenase-12
LISVYYFLILNYIILYYTLLFLYFFFFAFSLGPTGTGIGLHTSRWLAERGTHVILAGRSMERLKECEANIREVAKDEEGKKKEVQLTSIQLDVGSLSSVEEFSKKFKELNLPLNLLINNAGIMATPYQKTVDGFEIQFGTNHIGHHYLTNLLLPELRAGKPSRVVNVSSQGHRLANMDPAKWDETAFRPTEKQYGQWSAYGNSKLGNILLARSINQKYSGEGITAYSLHPGLVATELGRQGPFMKFVYGNFKFTMKTSEEGAGTSIWCATSDAALASAGKFHDKCAVATPSAKGRDGALAEALWIKTEEEITAWKNKQGAGVEGVPAASSS